MNGALIVNSGPAVDPNPNTTQPGGDRLHELPLAMGPPTVLWVAAVGGAPSVELWVAPLGDTPMTWIRIALTAPVTTPLVLAADNAVVLPPGAVPAGMPLFLRVTAVGGATKILAGFTRS